MGIKYVHTNIIARDWEAVARFYIEVFECKPYGPERDLSGAWIEQMTGVENVKVRGMHLSLPGYEAGPTLEIFSYEPEGEHQERHISKQGFGHLAFNVDNVEEVLKKVLAHGGKQYGEVIIKEYETLGVLTAVYISDPEGNLIEVQNWSR